MNVYDVINEKVLKMLRDGIIPWEKPWVANDMPKNLVSQKAYRGLNVFLLNTTAQIAGYKSNYWVTYKQAAGMGGNVRKGEKGTPVIFWTIVNKNDDEKSSFPLLRYYTVFNVEQCDNIPYPVDDTPSINTDESNPVADSLIWDNSRVPEIKLGGSRAFYNPAADKIQIPEINTFHSYGGFYSTTFHEIAHSTGHPTRLNREGIMTSSFGSEPYAREELIAEFAAAMLCAQTGVSNDALIENSGSYIAGWVTAIMEDKKILVSAAGRAQKAVDYILGTFDTESELENELQEA